MPSDEVERLALEATKALDQMAQLATTKKNCKNATAIRTYTDAGYTADSAVAAVVAGDPTLLEHTGLFSVQLQPPGSGQSPDDEGSGDDSPDPSADGSGQ